MALLKKEGLFSQESGVGRDCWENPTVTNNPKFKRYLMELITMCGERKREMTQT